MHHDHNLFYPTIHFQQLISSLSDKRQEKA